MLILQFTKLLTIMRKLLFLLLTIAIFTSCDKKNNPTPNNPKPEDEYPNLIVGNWKLIKSIIYYTPTGGGAETSFDATAQEGTNYYKFNTDNTLHPWFVSSQTTNIDDGLKKDAHCSRR